MPSLTFLAMTAFQASSSEAAPREGRDSARLCLLLALSSALLMMLGLFTEKCWLRKQKSNRGAITDFLLRGNLVCYFPKRTCWIHLICSSWKRKTAGGIQSPGSWKPHAPAGAGRDTVEVEMSCYINCCRVGYCLPGSHIICEEIHRFKVLLTGLLSNF